VELHDLVSVLTAAGPFVTVHVGSESDLEQAADKYELEWKNILAELGGKGVDDRTLQAIADAKGTHDAGASRLVVASTSDADVKVAVSLPMPPRRPVVDVAALPHLLPLIEDVTTRVSYVLVVADRTGAELSAFYDTETVGAEVTVRGKRTIERGPARGSWKHIYHEFPAEQVWMNRIAHDIVDGIARLAHDISAELIIAAGDVRVLSAIQDELPPDLKGRWATVEGGRGHDGSDQRIRQQVRDTVSRHLVDKSLAMLEDYAQERGQLRRACEGVSDVVAALRKAQVRTLLVTTQAPQEATLWFGSEPATIGETAAELRDLGERAPMEGPLVDVLIWSALATGANVQVVPHQLDEAPNGGVGAILRYSDDDNAAARD
jgi:hypothetical protein